SYATQPPNHRSTLSLHDALPIFLETTDYPMLTLDAATVPSIGYELTEDAFALKYSNVNSVIIGTSAASLGVPTAVAVTGKRHARSEEHTSELQSRENLVCRLLLE